MNFIGNKLTGFFMKRTMILNDLPRICFIFNKALQGNFQKQREYIQRQSVCICCFSGLYFPAFKLNLKIYKVNLHI